MDINNVNDERMAEYLEELEREQQLADELDELRFLEEHEGDQPERIEPSRIGDVSVSFPDEYTISLLRNGRIRTSAVAFQMKRRYTSVVATALRNNKEATGWIEIPTDKMAELCRMFLKMYEERDMDNFYRQIRGDAEPVFSFDDDVPF